MYRFSAFFLLLFMSLVLGCPRKTDDDGKPSPSGPTAPTGTTGTGSAAPFSCAKEIQKQPGALQSYYEDGFSHYGAFLLYYQDLIAKKGLDEAKKELNRIFNLSTEPGLFDKARSIYFGYKYDEALKKADAELKNPDLVKYWKDWCENPGNFISWLIIPLEHPPNAKEGDPLTLITDKTDKYLKTAFQDDGFASFKWITQVGETVGTAYVGTPADPKAWYK